MLIIDFFNKIFNKENLSSGVIFPNAITKEEYYERKLLRETLAISNTDFWDEINISRFNKNIEFFENNICPYCFTSIPIRKSGSFKCTKCKQKIYKKKIPYNNKEGLFTEESKCEADNVRFEFQKRISFLGLWDSIKRIVDVNLISDKKRNIDIIINALQNAKEEYYRPNNLNLLRDCRFLQAKLNSLYNNEKEAKKCYMQILYIDLMGDYCKLYDDPDFNQEELDLEFKKWDNAFIAPAIIIGAKLFENSISESRVLFEQSVKELIINFNFDLPITIEDAWNKILEYIEENKNEK